MATLHIPIERGWAVITEDGKRVGDVVDLKPEYIVASRGVVIIRDIYIPRYAIASVENNHVHLALPDARLRAMGWTSPPPTSSLVAPSAPEPELEAAQTVPFTEAMYDPIALHDQTFDAIGVFAGPYLEIDGDTHLRVQRHGSGPSIVLMHGWGVDSRVWDYVALDLARDHSVITYDARGYGSSSSRWGSYTLADASHDLHVIMTTFDAATATVVACDIAAAAALRCVIDGDLSPQSLVLLNPAITTSTEPLRLASDWRTLASIDKPALASTAISSFLPHADSTTHNWLAESILHANIHALDSTLDQLLTPYKVSANELSAISVETTVVTTTSILNSTADGLAALLPNGSHIALDTADFLPQVIMPTNIASIVRTTCLAPNPPEPVSV